MDFRPAADTFGATIAEVVRCTGCGHGSLQRQPGPNELDEAYAHVEDGKTLSEERGRMETARRDLSRLERYVGTERRRLLDVGCWTGSLVGAATDLGWSAQGIDPSAWAVERAREAGRDVARGILGDDDGFVPSTYQVVTCCDVLEHLVDPGSGAARIAEILEPGGLLFATVPDAGSRLARLLGRQWWSVLPMHVQYFTRRSIAQLLERAGFEIVEIGTHAKIFTRRYYGDRLGEFVPIVGPLAARVVARSRGADRPFAPDFRDRLSVIARKPIGSREGGV